MENPGEETLDNPAEVAGQEPAGPAPPSAGKSVFREIIETVLLALILALVIRAFLFESFLVQGNSMEPTLVDGERLLVNKLVYQFDAPSHGDIVVFRYPRDLQRDFIKRIVAVEGDLLEVRGGALYVNGVRQDEPYVTFGDTPDFGPVDVPPGHIFVLGDNRQNSRDSRNFGPVLGEYVKGRAMIVFWPPDEARLFHFPPPET